MHLDGDDSCAANLPTANVAALRDAVWRVRERLADILAACRRWRGRERVANIGAVAAGGLGEAAKERRRKVVGPRRELCVRRQGGRRQGREARHDGRPVERRGWEEQRCEHCFRSIAAMGRCATLDESWKCKLEACGLFPMLGTCTPQFMCWRGGSPSQPEHLVRPHLLSGLCAAEDPCAAAPAPGGTLVNVRISHRASELR